MKKKQITKSVAGVALDSDVIEYLEELGEREDRSRSWLINTIVREHAEKSGYKKSKSVKKRTPRR
jgi:predicted transcriptional regulator